MLLHRISGFVSILQDENSIFDSNNDSLGWSIEPGGTSSQQDPKVTRCTKKHAISWAWHVANTQNSLNGNNWWDKHRIDYWRVWKVNATAIHHYPSSYMHLSEFSSVCGCCEFLASLISWLQQNNVLHASCGINWMCRKWFKVAQV